MWGYNKNDSTGKALPNLMDQANTFLIYDGETKWHLKLTQMEKDL